MMSDEETEKAFNQALVERVRERREFREWSQEQMADFLGIPYERYRKYESRSRLSPLPMYLVERFAALTATELLWLVTGKGQKEEKASPAERRARRSA